MIQPEMPRPHVCETTLEHSDGQSWLAVLLPDFFVSFCAVTPRVSPHYQLVKEESEAWVST